MTDLLVQRGATASAPGGEGPAGPRLRLRERLARGKETSSPEVSRGLKAGIRHRLLIWDIHRQCPEVRRQRESFGIKFEPDSSGSTNNNSFQAFITGFQNNT